MIDAATCLCEPCAADLNVLFPGVRVSYEDPAFRNTQCQWHWIVRFKKAKELQVCLNGNDTLWIDGLPIEFQMPADVLIQTKPKQQGQRGDSIIAPISIARELDRRYKAIRK